MSHAPVRSAPLRAAVRVRDPRWEQRDRVRGVLVVGAVMFSLLCWAALALVVHALI